MEPSLPGGALPVVDPDDDEGEEPQPSRRHHAANLPLTTSEDLDRLSPEWAALHSATPGANPFQHPAFVRSWLRTVGTRAVPVFLSVRREEQLVGVVALDVQPGHASLLGDPEVSDFGPILSAPGNEPDVARGLMEWLSEDMTPAATIWGVDRRSPVRSAFAALAERFGWQVSEEDEAIAPGTSLDASFDDFVARLPKKDRHEVRRKLRNLESAGSVTFDEATVPEDVLHRFDRFLDLMRVSREDKAAFLDPPTEAFFRDLAASSSAAGLTRLSILNLDGAPVAITWSFETGGASWLYNSGFDPGHPGLSLGIVSKALGIRAAIERGNHDFSFLRGDEDYKRRLGGEPRTIVRIGLRQRA